MISYITLQQQKGKDQIKIIENGESKFFNRPLKGDWSTQRNFALAKSRGDWAFFLDSDEEISPSLRSELSNLPEGFSAFYIRRLDNFWGKDLHFGETGRIKLIRLARKNYGCWKGKVHETWTGNGKVGELKNPIYHSPHQTIKEFISKINLYTEIRSQELLESNQTFNALEAVLKPIGKFVHTYIFQLGFLDGLPGFVVSFLMSIHSLTVRVKLYDLSKNLSTARS